MNLLEDFLKRNSDRLLGLDDDWDGDGAQKFKPKTVQAALQLMRNIHASSPDLINNLLDSQIGPCSDGSVDIFWTKSGLSLLVNIAEGGMDATYAACSRIGYTTNQVTIQDPKQLVRLLHFK